MTSKNPMIQRMEDILSSGSEPDDEKIRVSISQDKIKKLQKMFPLAVTWEHDAKRVVKQFELEFDSKLSAYACPDLHNFRRSYVRIKQCFSAASLGWEYDLLCPQIDGLLGALMKQIMLLLFFTILIRKRLFFDKIHIQGAKFFIYVSFLYLRIGLPPGIKFFLHG